MSSRHASGADVRDLTWHGYLKSGQVQLDKYALCIFVSRPVYLVTNDGTLQSRVALGATTLGHLATNSSIFSLQICSTR